MDKIFNEKFKEEVKKTVKDLQERLYLKEWKIMIRYSQVNNPGNNNGERSLATMRPSYVYSNAVLTIFPMLVEETKHDNTLLQDVLCHEMIHCVTDELLTLTNARFATPPEITSANERLVQKITRIIEWNHSPKTNDIKKTRIKSNKDNPKTVQVLESRYGNRPATRVRSIKPRKGKTSGKIQVRRNKNKKDSNKSLAK